MSLNQVYRDIREEKREYSSGERDLKSKLETGEYPIRVTKTQRYRGLIENLLDGNLDFDGDIRLLDVGSSTGIATEYLANEIERDHSHSVSPFAFDINRMVLEECRDENRPEPIMGKAQDLPFNDNSFRLVISDNLYLGEHQIEQVASEIDRVMREDGLAALGRGYREFEGMHRGDIEIG